MDDGAIARVGSVRLGDRRVCRLGLGTNRLTDSEPNRAFLRRAVELGIDFLDTADVYQAGASESTLGEVLGPRQPDVLVATKGGMVRARDDRGVHGEPEHLRRAVEGSLRRLRVDRLELYQLHAVDPTVPIETSVGTLRELQREGRIARIGLSNVSVDELERARRVAPIVSVQNRYNLFEREQESVLEYCERHEIVFLPWTPLRRGNLPLAGALNGLAVRHGATPQQLALSWLLRRSPWILPIPGTLSVRHLEENLAAMTINWGEDDLQPEPLRPRARRDGDPP